MTTKSISEPSDELVLKPCPWCASEPVAQHVRHRSWLLGCINNDCNVRPDSWGYSKARAIAAWNARAAIAAMPELTELQQKVKQLEEGLRDAVDLVHERCLHSENGCGLNRPQLKRYNKARSLLSDKGEEK